MNTLIKYNKKNFVLFLLGSFIVLLIFLLAGIEETINLLLKINFETILFLFLIEFLIIFLHSLRWRIILHNNVCNKEVTFKNIFLSTNIGLFASNIVPAGTTVSEPIRAYVLSKADNFPMIKSFASSIVNLMLEVLPIFLLISIAIYFVIANNISPFLLAILIFAFLVVLFLSTISFLSITNKKLAMKTANFFVNFFSKLSFLKKHVEEQKKDINRVVSIFCESAQTNASKKNLFFGTSISLITWILNFLRTYIIFIAVGFNINIAIFVTIMVVVYVVSFIPTTPGGIGIYELSSVGLFSLFGVSIAVASIVTIIDRFFSYWLVCIVGYVSLLFITKKI